MREDRGPGRWQARALVAIAVLLPLVAVLAWVVRPGFMGPMFAHPSDESAGLITLAIGALGTIAGELWIHRILSGVGKDGPTTWRYRR